MDNPGISAAGCPADAAGCAIRLVPGVRGTSGGRDGEVIYSNHSLLSRD
jgi:hypothetical protein